MADHDQKADKKMGQNDKNLIQDVAMEVKDKDKSKTQSQEDIEEIGRASCRERV